MQVSLEITLKFEGKILLTNKFKDRSICNKYTQEHLLDTEDHTEVEEVGDISLLKCVISSTQ